jgi:hypothetical protein
MAHTRLWICCSSALSREGPKQGEDHPAVAIVLRRIHADKWRVGFIRAHASGPDYIFVVDSMPAMLAG